MNAKELGHRIKKVRKSNNLTQAELGKIVEKEYSTIGRYENGILPVPSDVLIKIVEYFNLSADWLLFGEDDKTPDFEKTNTISKLNLVFDALTPANQEETLDFMDFKLARQEKKKK